MFWINCTVYNVLFVSFAICVDSRGEQIPGLCCIMFFGSLQYCTCFMSPFWHLEFWGSSKIFGKFVHPLCRSISKLPDPHYRYLLWGKSLQKSVRLSIICYCVISGQIMMTECRERVGGECLPVEGQWWTTKQTVHLLRRSFVLLKCFCCRSVKPLVIQDVSVTFVVIYQLTVWRLTTPYMGRTAPLTFKRCILYIYSTNIGTEYFRHALYSPLFFLFKMQFVS